MTGAVRNPRNLREILTDARIALILTAIASILSVALDLDTPYPVTLGILAALLIALLFVLKLTLRILSKIILTILVIATFAGLTILVNWLFRPTFGVTALDTLDGDTNIYEVTDILIDADTVQLETWGITTTLALEIKPTYEGRKLYGGVVVRLSGDGRHQPAEEHLWDYFSSDTKPKRIHLTLAELCEISGIEKNASPADNLLRPGDPYFQEAKLIVDVAPKTDTEHPWERKKILVRNAPWEQQSNLVWRNDRHELDLYLRNPGGAGEFRFYYNLVRLDKKVDSNTHPMWSGTTYVESGRMPDEPVTLGTSEFFTHTHVFTSTLTPGHYMLEVNATKKQNYALFLDTSVPFFDSPDVWIFGGAGMLHPFVIPAPSIDALTQPEWDRLRAEGIDLGPALGPLKEITSLSGAKWQHQPFENGEIHVRDGQSYAIYGDIYDVYTRLRVSRGEMKGFPLSSIEPVTSSFGTPGTMMRFEGSYWPHSPTVLYASEKAKVAMWGLIGQAHMDEYGGHAGWLGFPVTDELDDGRIGSHNAIQMFEGGYLVWRTEAIHPPVAVAYFGPQGTRIEVWANQPWQDTGIQVQDGARVTIAQVDGAWTAWKSEIEPHDANGTRLQWDSKRLESAPAGALIGRVGPADREAFFVGRWCERMVGSGGTLYLGINDHQEPDRYVDNDGSITVLVLIEPPESR